MRISFGVSAGIVSGRTSSVSEIVSFTSFFGVGIGDDDVDDEDEEEEAVADSELEVSPPLTSDVDSVSESVFPFPPKKPFTLSIMITQDTRIKSPISPRNKTYLRILLA